MKREIKYRAWDKEKKKMVYDIPILILCDGTIWPHDLGYFHNSQQWTKDEGLIVDFELLQFTGLKDNDLKEIFEGDVVNFWGGVGKIIYFNLYASFKIKYKGNELFDLSDQVIVIGNIYENPELICISD